MTGGTGIYYQAEGAYEGGGLWIADSELALVDCDVYGGAVAITFYP